MSIGQVPYWPYSWAVLHNAQCPLCSLIVCSLEGCLWQDLHLSEYCEVLLSEWPGLGYALHSHDTCVSLEWNPQKVSVSRILTQWESFLDWPSILILGNIFFVSLLSLPVPLPYTLCLASHFFSDLWIIAITRLKWIFWGPVSLVLDSALGSWCLQVFLSLKLSQSLWNGPCLLLCKIPCFPLLLRLEMCKYHAHFLTDVMQPSTMFSRVSD